MLSFRMAAEGTAKSEKPAERIGKYEVVAKIGQGAMGEVYKARDTVLDRFVAIKTMAASILANPEMGQRFLREAQSAARLNHPNIVILHEFGEADGRFFMAMELLDGEDLAHRLRRGALTSLHDQLTVMEQILDGVGYAHASGVVHRDLKPANIQIQKNGQVKVMDFGLARIGESEMTRAGTVMGTPHYMSPEQVRGEKTSTASDVFALGSVFYEILGGRRAFDADSMHAILYKVAEAQPTPLSECRADIPPVLIRFVGKALVKAPELRFRDGGEMRHALELCRGVLDGSLEEAEALAAMGEAPTLIYSPDSSASATVISETPKGAVALPPSRSMSTLGSAAGALGTSAGARRNTQIARPPTALSEPAPPVPGSAPSRLPLVLGGIAVLGLAYVLLTRNSPAPPAPGMDHQAQAAVSAAVDAQMDAARRSLDFKDPEGAMASAEKALRFEPDNQEAREIMKRARAALDEAESLAGEARKAAEAGRLDDASKSLARVLEIMPRHPVAAELSAQLASRFQTKADAASREMNRAAEAARRAGATSFRAYGEASTAAGRATAAYNRKQYTEAAQQFAEAQRSYEAAMRDAQDLASKRVAAVPSATAAPVVAPPTPVPTLPPAPVTPRPTLAPTPAPTVAAVAPPVRTVRDDETAIREVLDNLKRAIEDKDLALYKRIRPGLSADEERRLRDAFQNVNSQQVEYSINSIEVKGDRAELKVTRGGRVSGQSVPTTRQTLKLVRTPSGWIIDEIGQ